jgi:hypothetical protein
LVVLFELDVQPKTAMAAPSVTIERARTMSPNLSIERTCLLPTL